MVAEGEAERQTSSSDCHRLRKRRHELYLAIQPVQQVVDEVLEQRPHRGQSGSRKGGRGEPPQAAVIRWIPIQHPTVKQAVQDAVLAEPPKDLVQSPFAQISAKASIAVESVDIAIPSDDPYAVRRVMDRVKLAQPSQSRIRIRSKVWVEKINLNVLCLFRTSFYLSAKPLSINYG